MTTKVDVSLVSESIKIDEIVVQAEAPLITKDLTSTSAIVTSDDIKMMPVENIGTNYQFASWCCRWSF